jgi:hypothetical protein
MNFDEELTRAFDTLTERLRGEIDREVERRTAEQSAILAEQAAEAAASAPPPAPLPAAAGASLDRLARGFDAIDDARSLTAILDALLAFATEDAPDASVWLIRGGRPHRWRGAGAADSANDTEPSLDEGIPLRLAGEVVALLANSELTTQNSELTTQNSELGTPNAEPRTSNVTLLARYAAKSLESLTAFTTARALTQRAAAANESATRNPESAMSEEDTSAKRYARLLVSEIKLYHEPAVVDGRRDRDLATRLGGEIARARVMYEERVPVHVRERRDYFQEELVKTLADGDSSLLELRT